VDADLQVLEAFLNTGAHGDDPDALSDVAGLDRWAGTAHDATRRDLARARALRSALREALRRSGAADIPGRLAAACEPYLLRAGDLAADEPPLVALGDGAHAAVGRVAAALATARAAGRLDRLKVCPGDDCGYAFIDSSKNRSRRWCAMRACGNKSKIRAYRIRHDPRWPRPTARPPAAHGPHGAPSCAPVDGVPNDTSKRMPSRTGMPSATRSRG
jgi:predicted RNA-binding Zn ribbon-like protein